MMNIDLVQVAWDDDSGWQSAEDRVIPPSVQRRMAMRANAEVMDVCASPAVCISQRQAAADAIDASARSVESQHQPAEGAASNDASCVGSAERAIASIGPATYTP